MASEPRTSSDAAASGPTAAAARPDFGERLAQRVRPRQRVGRQALGRAAGDVVRRSVEFATSVGVSATGRWTLARHRAGTVDRLPVRPPIDYWPWSTSEADADADVGTVAERIEQRGAATSALRRHVTAAGAPAAPIAAPGGPAVAADTARRPPTSAAAATGTASWGTSKLDELARRLGVGAPVEVDASPPPDARDAAGATRPVADASGRRAGRGAAATAGSPARRGLPLTAARRGATVAGPATSPGAIASGLRAELDASPPSPAANVRRATVPAARPTARDASATAPAVRRASPPGRGAPGSPPAPSGSGPPPRPTAPGASDAAPTGAGGFASRAPQPGGDVRGTEPRAATTTEASAGLAIVSRQVAAVLPPDLQALEQTLPGAGSGRVEQPTPQPAIRRDTTPDPWMPAAPIGTVAAGSAAAAGRASLLTATTAPVAQPWPPAPAPPRSPDGPAAWRQHGAQWRWRLAPQPDLLSRSVRPAVARVVADQPDEPSTGSATAGVRPPARPPAAATSGARPASRSSVAAAPAVGRAGGDPGSSPSRGGEATVPGATAQPGTTPLAPARGGTGTSGPGATPWPPGSALPTPAGSAPGIVRRTADDARRAATTAPTAPATSGARPRRPGPDRIGSLGPTARRRRDPTPLRAPGDTPAGDVRRSVGAGTVGSAVESSAGGHASPAGDGPVVPGAGPDVRVALAPDVAETPSVAERRAASVTDLAARRRPIVAGHPAGAIVRADEIGVVRRLPSALVPDADDVTQALASTGPMSEGAAVRPAVVARTPGDVGGAVAPRAFAPSNVSDPRAPRAPSEPSGTLGDRTGSGGSGTGTQHRPHRHRIVAPRTRRHPAGRTGLVGATHRQRRRWRPRIVARGRGRRGVARRRPAIVAGPAEVGEHHRGGGDRPQPRPPDGPPAHRPIACRRGRRPARAVGARRRPVDRPRPPRARGPAVRPDGAAAAERARRGRCDRPPAQRGRAGHRGVDDPAHRRGIGAARRQRGGGDGQRGPAPGDHDRVRRGRGAGRSAGRRGDGDAVHERAGRPPDRGAPKGGDVGRRRRRASPPRVRAPDPRRHAGRRTPPACEPFGHDPAVDDPARRPGAPAVVPPPPSAGTPLPTTTGAAAPRTASVTGGGGSTGDPGPHLAPPAR